MRTRSFRRRVTTSIWQGVIISAASLSFLIHLAPNTCAQTGPAAYWQAEGNARDSVGTNHGVLKNGVSFAFGAGQAFSFDGVDDYVDNSPLAWVSNTFTIAFWASPSGSRANTPEEAAGITGSGGQQYAVMPQYAGAYGIFYGACAGVSVGTNGISVFEHAGTYLPSLLVFDAPISGWTHIAVIYINKQPRLYINGTLVRTGLVSPREFVVPSAALGGDSINGSYGPYHGFLDEILIYDRALTGEEVAALAFQMPKVGMPAVFVNGAFVAAESAKARGFADVTLTTSFPGGTIFYTIDGSDPALTGRFYAGPFTVRQSIVLRTIAYNVDFSRGVTRDPIEIVILPTLTCLTAGGGSVAAEPAAGDYFSNSLALVTATPAPGWTFLQWLGDADGTNPAVSVSMTRNKTVRAVFGGKFNASVVGGGNLVVDPMASWHPYGSQVRFTAVPTTGNALLFWANAASGETNNPLNFTVTNANQIVTAVFASLGGSQTNNLTVIPTGRGQVLRSPEGSHFQRNSLVTLQAAAEAGQQFLGWSGDTNGSENPLVVTMNSSKVIVATFTRRPRLVGEGHLEDGFRLTLAGESGDIYKVFQSSDLSTWTLLSRLTNTWGAVQFTDHEAITNTHRAYRARVDE